MPWDETVALGQRIVNEWGDRPGVLIRWMAHRIAELMDQAKTAETDDDREAARSECTDLVMRLWKRRSHWPYGAPLGRVAHALSALAGKPGYGEPYEKDQPSPEDGWWGILNAIDQLGNQEFEVVRHAAVAALDLQTEEEWLEAHGGSLSDDERKIVELLILFREQAKGERFKLGEIEAPGFSELAEEERTALVLRSLAEIAERRAALIRSVVSGDKSGE